MSNLKFKPADFYEDCAFHPCLCTHVSGHDIEGISLIDGSVPRSCDIVHCGVRKLTLEDVLQIKEKGPLESESRDVIPPDKRWWR